MNRYLALSAALLAGACASNPPTQPLDVAVTRRGADWTADFTFPRRARAWAFVRSSPTREGARPWRPQSWTIETPGVRLERRGHYDLLVAERGRRLPKRVRVRFAPFTGDLAADYDPALAFTDGSVALYSEQFDAFPLRSPARAERLPIDPSDADVPASPTQVTFRDAAGAVLHAGQRVDAASIDDDAGSYVLFGSTAPVAGEAMTTIIDPQLPAWIRQSLSEDMPALLARYAAALGAPPGPKPTLMVSWAGPTPRLTSMGGSVLPGLIAMTWEGSGVLAESDALRRQALWFIAHEGAHFWLGQAVAYQYSREAWITEGGADLLAIRTVPWVDPAFNPLEKLQQAVEDCAALTVGRGVASAEERNEHRAYYACGAVFGLIAEASSRQAFATFIRALLDTHRNDGVVTRRDWLAMLDAWSGDPTLSADIGRLLDRGADDPKAVLASLFVRAGIAHTIDGDGMPRLQ